MVVMYHHLSRVSSIHTPNCRIGRDLVPCLEKKNMGQKTSEIFLGWILEIESSKNHTLEEGL